MKENVYLLDMFSDYEPPEGIAKAHIEVVKGASSALYGSNAGGGVINIITKKASKSWGVSAGVRFARHKEQRYNLSVMNCGTHLQNVLSGSFFSVANYDVHSAPNRYL